MSGRILLDGRDIYAPGVDVPDLRRRVGMVFALPLPLPGTIRENVDYGPRLAGDPGPDMAGRGPRPQPDPRRRFGTRSRTGWTLRPARSPAGSSSGCASLAAWPWSPRCCCSTSRPRAWTPSPPARWRNRFIELKARVHHRHRAAQRPAGGPRGRLCRLFPDGRTGRAPAGN